MPNVQLGTNLPLVEKHWDIQKPLWPEEKTPEKLSVVANGLRTVQLQCWIHVPGGAPSPHSFLPVRLGLAPSLRVPPPSPLSHFSLTYCPYFSTPVLSLLFFFHLSSSVFIVIKGQNNVIYLINKGLGYLLSI